MYLQMWSENKWKERARQSLRRKYTYGVLVNVETTQAYKVAVRLYSRVAMKYEVVRSKAIISYWWHKSANMK